MPPRKKVKPEKVLSLSEEQQAVVSARNGFWCVEAGPGAGKSATLVERLATLIKEGVSPDSLLSLSFTSIAAKNLRTRVEEKVGKLTTSRVAGCLTFHSAALSFAQEERDAFPFKLAEFPLATEPVSAKLSGDSARKFDLNPRILRPVVSLYKRRRIRPREAVRDAENNIKAAELKLALAYADYEKRCAEQGLLDFDSLIFQMVEILDKNPKIREGWVRDYIQLDESQDTSKIEWDLVKLISGRSVLAVGDASQGIYSFRGSDPKLFQNMSDIFPGTKTLYLSCNYRSTPEIVDFFRPIAASKELASKFHASNASGPAPVVKGFASLVLEAKWVVEEIKKRKETK